MSENKPENKMSEKDRKKTENYERIRAKMAADGYTEKPTVISIVKANVLAFATAGPFAILIAVIFFLCRSSTSENLDGISMLIFWAVFIISIPFHEFLHGLGWSFNCKNGWKSISFGFILKALTPYCHCSEELSLGAYFLGSLFPFVILGIIPGIISIITSSGLLMMFSFIEILMAGGDTTISLLLCKFIGKNVKIIDHPTECGCMVFTKEQL